MISHKYKTIFIHINRTGGSSIETVFNKELSNHERPNKIIKKIGLKKWNSYFKFTFVRNPWDRIVSIYHHRKQNRKIINQKFQKWIYSIDEFPTINQIWWIKHDGKIDMDFIGKFENLEIDFKKVCRKIKAKFNLPHTNASKHIHYSSYYDLDSKKFVAKVCEEEIELFKYKFDDL